MQRSTFVAALFVAVAFTMSNISAEDKPVTESVTYNVSGMT